MSKTAGCCSGGEDLIHAFKASLEVEFHIRHPGTYLYSDVHAQTYNIARLQMTS